MIKMRCKRRFLVFSFVILGVLVFSAGSMAVLSSSPTVRAIGEFSDTLPTADGQITPTEQGYCDHLQLTMDIYGGIPNPYFINETINIDVYSAYNGTLGNPGSYIYFGIVAHDLPFLANITLDPYDEPVGFFNLTAVWLRFDNDGDGTIGQGEDKKGVWMGNETWVLGDDSYWNITADDEDYDYDDDSDGQPTEGNITAYNMTHDNTAAQGNFG
ncbi:MAG: hypothetical protein Q6356_010575, partial [Candidatus Wukongarchaeota archaeon]|nr:hypothetical protein [Candidatus Wukongarchaeota archaeon]